MDAGAAAASSTPAATADAPGATLDLRTAAGVVQVRTPALASSLSAPAVRCTNPSLLLPLVTTALALMVLVPLTSEAKMVGVIETFLSVLAFWGVALQDVNWSVVVAYVVVRCAPPAGLPLPPRCAKPVLAQTAAGDIDALRRAARLGLRGLSVLRDVLYDDHVSQLLRALGGRMKRLKSNKKPLLFVQVEKFVTAALKTASTIILRDACALAVCFFFALRVSELLALMPRDVAVVDLTSRRRALSRQELPVFIHHGLLHAEPEGHTEFCALG